jgi:hypothetical protein
MVRSNAVVKIFPPPGSGIQMLIERQDGKTFLIGTIPQANFSSTCNLQQLPINGEDISD